MPHKTNKSKIKTGRMIAEALVRADSFDPSTRTVEVCWATTNPVRRATWEGPFLEVLSMDPKHIRLGRMQTGALSLLDTHDSWEMDKRLGVVLADSLKFEKDKAFCRVQISQTGKGADLLTDLADGMPFPVSVGYRVYEYTEVANDTAEIPTRTATDWEPMEISAVPIPADPGALSRNAEEGEYECDLIRAVAPTHDAAPTAIRKEPPMKKRDAAKTLKGAELDAFALAFEMKRDANETDEAFSVRLIAKFDADDATDATRSAPVQNPEPSQQVQAPGQRSLTDADVIRLMEEGTKKERARVDEIRKIGARMSGTDDAFVQQHIDAGTQVEAFRGALLDHLAERQERAPTFPVFETRGGRDERETMRRLATNGMMHRLGLTQELEDGAHEYRSMSAPDLAREVLMRTGGNFRGSNADIIARSLNSTSDFPIILGDITRQTLMNAYSLEQETNTYQLIASRNVMTDLRDVKVLELGDGPELELLTEKGEYKRGTLKESKESFGIQHYGKVLGLTEAMLINDQLGAFAKAIASWGRVVARLEGNIVWNVINTNMVLTSDSKSLFHADHGNLAGTGTTLDKTNMIAARKAFRKMKNIDGQQITLKPDYVFVGTDLEVEAQVLLQSTTSPATPNDVIPQALKSITPVYESRIDVVSSKAWYLFASPSQTLDRGLQYSVLSGYETPRMKDRWGFDYDGVEYRLDHYFGAGLTDYRFAYKNPGL